MGNVESAFMLVSGGGVATLILLLFFLIGLWLLIAEYGHNFIFVSERPFFFGGIYILTGGALFLVAFALMKYVFPLVEQSSYVLFIGTLSALLFLIGLGAVLAALVLIIKCGIFRHKDC